MSPSVVPNPSVPSMLVGIALVCASALAETLYSGMEDYVASARALTPQSLAAIEATSASGDLNAKVTLGFAYLEGTAGLPVDYKRAATLFEQAAIGGQVYGQLMIATLHLEGKGAEGDGAKAVVWLQKAAEQNNTEALYLLGNINLFGAPSVAANPIEAYKWLSIGAAMTSSESKRRAFLSGVKLAEKNLSSVQLETAKNLADEWLSTRRKPN